MFARNMRRKRGETMKQLTYKQILQRLADMPQRTVAQVDKDLMGNTIINFRDGMMQRRMRQ